jgi:uncharacterized membrane protein YgcG
VLLPLHCQCCCFLPTVHTAPAPADVAGVLLSVPLTATAQLEAAVRVVDMNLQPSRQWQMPEFGNMSRDVHMQTNITMFTTQLVMRAFAAAARQPGNDASQAAGMLRAAAAATDASKLASQLHSLLVSSCKCLLKRWSGSLQLEPHAVWACINAVDQMMTGIVDSMRWLALPDSALQSASSSSSSKAGGSKKTSSKGSSSGSKGRSSNGGEIAAATSSSSSSSGVSLAQRLGPGLSPWLHLAGRGLLLLPVLLLHLESR